MSRQREWQLKMQKQGRCICCGEKLDKKGLLCVLCQKIKQEKKHHKRRLAKKIRLSGKYVIDINGKVRKSSVDI